MVSLATLRELFVYNYWARDRQLHACEFISQEQFLQPLGNSFSSLRDTLAHLIAGEWIWQERWWGRSPKAFPAAADYPDLAAIREAWRPVEQGVRDYLAKLDEETVAGRFTFIRTTGESFTYPIWRSLLHVSNHQSYHRGQVTMFLRQFGAQPPSIDLTMADILGVFEEPAGQKYMQKHE